MRSKKPKQEWAIWHAKEERLWARVPGNPYPAGVLHPTAGEALRWLRAYAAQHAMPEYVLDTYQPVLLPVEESP